MNPIKVAIIGGGPSAFYVAARLLSLLPHAHPHSASLRVHLYDRLWAPHGLVRYGVAPDHPEVKNCTHKFDDMAADARFRFFGNVNVGDTAPQIDHVQRLPLTSIFSNYSHVVFATGCTESTLHPALPPSQYCVPALSLVHWYTQHPSRPSPPPLEHTPHITLIGNGNVSLDIARILLTPVSALSQYDVPSPVLDVLARSQVKHVSILGRRGPLEAAFTTKELREMMNLPDASMVPIDSMLFSAPPGVTPTRQQSRALQLLQKGSRNTYGSTPKTWSLDFFRSPVRLTSDPAASSATLEIAHTTLDPNTHRAVPTGTTSSLSTSLVVTSLGFRAEPVGAFYDAGLGHIRTQAGRVVDGTGAMLKNVYAAGWAATGAKGVLASTMINSYAVADTMLRDWMPGDQTASTPAPMETQAPLNPAPHPEDPPAEIADGLKGGVVTDYATWKAVDAEEVRRGADTGKERERMGWPEAHEFITRFRARSGP
ncbi:hypothetical protein BD779DRAFT_1611980 [Infundibulicybe gibba]|nr:hypothetical protein BD779DRAFT_1611980 [Infundibulicybe gibba]